MAVDSERTDKEHEALPLSLRQLMLQFKSTLYFIMFISFVTTLLSLTPVIFMLNVFDRVVTSRSLSTLFSLLLIVLVLYCFNAALEWIRDRILARLSLRIDWDLAARVFDASFRRYLGYKNVNVQQVMGDLVQLRTFITGNALVSVIEAPMAILFIIISFFFHPLMAAFIFVAVVILTVAMIFTKQMTSPILRAANEQSAEANKLAEQSLRYSELAHALGMQAAIKRRWHEKHRQFLQMQVNANESSGLLGSVSRVLYKTLPSLQISLGAYLAIIGAITPGMMIAANLLIGKALSPMRSLITNWKSLVDANMAYERIERLLEEDQRNIDKLRLPAPLGRMEVTGLIATPPGSTKIVLNNINLAVSPGTVVGIVGPSGSGKSSLARLLVGIWKPARGTVRLDGAEISEWDHDEVGPHLGYVPQEISFFDGTIAENIARLGTVDPDKVVDAAKIVGIHETILALPDGYETLIKDGNIGLSGGERQRVAIARAVYGFPKFIMLDEPNASLDDAGEQALIKTIRQLKRRGSTIFFISHRQQLLAAADMMLVLKDGRQLGFGDPREMFDSAKQTLPVPESPKAIGSNA